MSLTKSICPPVVRRFVIILEACLIVAVGIAVAGGFFAKTRQAWIGLFAVATLLYIQLSDTYLSAEDALEHYGARDRSRTMTAGCIMTATVNCFLLLAMGMIEDAAAPAKDATSV
jgi:hypothetical protein